jgi:hypothetical protein
MPYRTIEQITSRGYEKVTQFLSVAQLFGSALGALVGGGLMVVVNNAILGATLLALLAALGYLLATEMDGMAPYERLLWRLRGLMRGAVQGRIITPDDLPGVVVDTQKIPITWSGSTIQFAPEPGTTVANTPPVADSRPTMQDPAHAAL